MSWNTRRASIVLLVLFVTVSAAWLDQGHAQDKGKLAPGLPITRPPLPPGKPNPAVNPDGFLRDGIHLAKDEKNRGKAIEAAIDYIGEGKWDIAIESLQKLLKIDEDVFVRLKRKNDEGNEIYVWVSAKQEADRLIGTLPPKGLDAYKVAFNDKAAGILMKAKKN